MRVLFLVTVCFMLIGSSSCSDDFGDPDRLLDLHGGFGQMTEGELREALQETGFGESVVDELQCTALSKISDDEAVEALELLVGSEDFNPDDERRLVELYREVCDSAFD